MRILGAIVVIALAVTAGGVQFLAAVGLRDRAVAGAWVRLVPQRVADDVAAREVDWPLPQALKLVLARRALDVGDDVRATAIVARMSDSPDKLALEGRLDQARGDVAGAMRSYLAAGDLQDVEARVASFTGPHVLEALPYQYAVVDRLEDDRTQRDTLAKAYYDLGGLEELAAYRYFLPSLERSLHQKLAGVAFARALALSPTQQQYVIAYGNQLLNLGRWRDARVAFSRAIAADPRDSTPVAGVGEAEFGEGHMAAARAALSAARRLNENDPAVLRLARRLGP